MEINVKELHTWGQWVTWSVRNEDLFQGNVFKLVVRVEWLWRSRLIGTIYQETPANGGKLFQLRLITTICNKATVFQIYVQWWSLYVGVDIGLYP